MRSSGTPVSPDTIAEIVERTWRAEGLTFKWSLSTQPERLENLDVMVLVEDKRLQNAPPDALGAVRFVNGQPQKIVRVSAAAVATWMTARMIAARVWPVATPPSLARPAGGLMYDRAIAYVVAHEIGHVLLATRGHSNEGVMRAGYVDVMSLHDNAPPLTLDDKARERLRLRMAGTALCG